jgi:hypothetical protein
MLVFVCVLDVPPMGSLTDVGFCFRFFFFSAAYHFLFTQRIYAFSAKVEQVGAQCRRHV